MHVYEREVEAAGLDVEEVKRIARGLERYAKQAQAMGMIVFGGSGSGSLRARDGQEQCLVLAHIGGHWDGGDGAAQEDADGLMRGE